MYHMTVQLKLLVCVHPDPHFRGRQLIKVGPLLVLLLSEGSPTVSPDSQAITARRRLSFVVWRGVVVKLVISLTLKGEIANVT